MEFTPKSLKSALKIRFIEGSLNRFDGKTLSIGIGERKALPRRKFVLLARKVVSVAKQHKAKVIEVNFKDLRALAMQPETKTPFAGMTDFEVGEVAATAFVMADYEYVSYKSKPKEGFDFIKTVAVIGVSAEVEEGFWRGHQIADMVNTCRNLSNTPGGDMTPQMLAEAAQKLVKGAKTNVQVLGVSEMEELGMGAILGVGKGSNHEPKFIVAEYHGGDEKDKPIVLVGKGVTFDTGGLNIKPGDHMYEMHMDMSGGAAVICAVALAAKLKIKTNVVALVPAVENAASGSSVRPGDILKSMSGKTIEVLNTDAEGRVILADAITYAKRFSPHLVVDVATLTGAALVALGQQASAFMTNTQDAIPNVMEVAEKSGDYMWPMPAWEEYEEMTKGTFGDVPNISTAGNSRYGGVIAGGMFLKRFYDDLKCNWLHIDMAPRMTSTPNECLAKGAAGAPVRFLLKLIEKYAKA